MADDLQQLDETIAALVRNIAPAQRRRMARTIAVAIRKSNADRIGAQVDPDGRPFTPRRPYSYRPSFAKSRKERGRILRRQTARKMFAKLRRATILRARWTDAEASAGFSGGATGRIAAVHHGGLRDKVYRRGAKMANYPERRLLGWPEADRQMVLDRVLAQLSAN